MSKKSFKERYKTMGDMAEARFTTWATQSDIPFERWGWDRPSFKKFNKLPSKLRHSPDFVCEFPKEFRFVEVKGVGRDQVVKFKVEDLGIITETMCFYDMPCYYFVYDSSQSRITTFDAQLLIDADKSELIDGYFWDGFKKPYWGVPTQMEWFEWTTVPAE